jgi:hypothetical protein
MHEFAAPCRQIPCESEQGIFLREQGILFAEQGTQGRQQGMGGGPSRTPTRAPICVEFVVRRATAGRNVSLHQQRRLSRNQLMNKVEIEPSKTPPFAQIADLIAGPQTPAWLPGHLRRWADSVSLNRAVEKFQPSKAEMRELLIRVVGAAEFLHRAVAHPAVREFLESPPAGPIENIVLFDRNLRDS